MEVLDLIYHQFFFTANRLVCQPTTFQFYELLTLQTLTLAALVIHFLPSEYVSGKKSTVMISQDEYYCKFCPSPVMNFSLEATAFIIQHIGRLLHTPTVCTTPLSLALLNIRLLSSDWIATPMFHSMLHASSCGAPPLRWVHLNSVGTSLYVLPLLHVILQSLPAILVLVCCNWSASFPLAIYCLDCHF